jgi:dihydroorotate dehydrogenase
VDPDTLEFEVNVDGLVSSGGLGGPAIMPMSLAKMAQMTQAYPHREFSGIGGISAFEHALAYFMLGCGTVQVATAAMLDHAIGPNVIRGLLDGMTEFLERNAHRGWTSLADFRGLLRDRVVAQSAIARPDAADYRGGYEGEEAEAEGYAREPAGVIG